LSERWKLTEEERKRLVTKCPRCGSGNLDPSGGPNSANGWVKCYDCGHGPFWWLKGSNEILIFDAIRKPFPEGTSEFAKTCTSALIAFIEREGETKVNVVYHGVTLKDLEELKTKIENKISLYDDKAKGGEN